MSKSRKANGIAVIKRAKEHAPNHADNVSRNRGKLARKGLLTSSAPHALLFGWTPPRPWAELRQERRLERGTIGRDAARKRA
jgi:hypothetical protein